MVSTAKYFVPHLLARFHAQHPGVEVRLHVASNREQLVALMQSGDIDLSIMGRPPQDLDARAEAFARHPLAFVAAPSHPLARGFDTFWGYTSGHWGEYFDAPLEHNGVMKPSQGYIVDVLTDKALQFIERNRSKPFLCYVPFTTPHSPWSVPAADWARFKDKPLTQTATQAAQEKLEETRCAYAMVENQDRNVGRILARLKELDLDTATLVV